MDEIEQETAGLSRAEILQDVAKRIEEAFTDGSGRDNNFRSSDAFAGYGGTVTVELELLDFDTQSVKKVISIPAASAAEVRARSGTMPPDLTKPIGAPTTTGFDTNLSKPATA